MVIDQAKVNRLCILMLHRLHASKVSEGCVSSFVPCTSPCPKPSLPHPLFNLQVWFKRGWQMGEKHLSILNKLHDISSLLSFAATAYGVLHHRLLKRECVCIRGGGRRHSSIAQRVLNGQNVCFSLCENCLSPASCFHCAQKLFSIL